MDALGNLRPQARPAMPVPHRLLPGQARGLPCHAWVRAAAWLTGLVCWQILVRVSEHMPEIVAYVEAIKANGFAYVAGGSVYFDTQAFR